MAPRAVSVSAVGVLGLALLLPPVLMTPREPLDWSPWPPDFIEQALLHSPTYCRILEISDRPEYYLEHQGPEFLEVDIGCDVEIAEDLHRFDRWATLRLFRGGAISRLGYDAVGEYQWGPEYRP